VSSAASEIGHWYTRDGKPVYTVIGKNGQERATTLRDARTNGYVPSVTTVLQCAAKPGLERWKAEQVLLAGLTLPRLPDEDEKSWMARVWEDSKQQAQKAAERGTVIHGAIERRLRGESVEDDLKPYADAALDCIEAKYGQMPWSPEKSFASPLGYGGKVDLHAPGLVLDFKTKDGDVSDVKCYQDHHMQCAAYAAGLGMVVAECGIVFVSRTQPQASLVLHSPDETMRGLAMFKALLDYWYAQTGLAR